VLVDLNPGQLEALVAIADYGSFEAAARQLHVTPSAVSQRIRALEAAAGQVLISRGTPCRPTPHGEWLVRLGRQTRLLYDEASQALDPATVVELPVAVNADSLAAWFGDVLAALAGWEGTAIRLRVEDQAYSQELLRGGDVLAAVTSDPAAVQGCTVQPLGALRYVPAAAPAFATRWRRGQSPDWAAMPVVNFNDKDELQQDVLRRHGAGLPPVVHQVPTNADFYQAVRVGLGWAALPEPQARADLAAGRLVRLSDDLLDVPLYWQRWRLDSPRLAALTDAVREAASRHLLTAVGLRLLGDVLAAAQPADLGVDEVVDLPVEHGLCLRGLMARPLVLHHLVRIQDVVADLRPPGAAAVALEGGQFAGLFLAAALKQLGLEHGHRGRPVLDLGALVLAGHHDPGRQMRDPDGRVGRVHTLTAGTRGAEHVHADLVVGDVNMIGLLNDGHYVHPGERRLATALVVVLGDADHAVRALLAAQRAVRVRRLHRERGGLYARLTVGDVEDLGRVLVTFRPAQVHPLQVPREVLRVRAAGLRVDRDQRLALVVLAVKQGAYLELVDLLAQLGKVARRLVMLGQVVLFVGKLEHNAGVLETLPQVFQPRQLSLQIGEPPADLLPARLVLPQPWVGGLLSQVGRLGLHRIGVDYSLDRVELRRQFRYLIGGIGSCHAGKPTRGQAAQRNRFTPANHPQRVFCASVAHRTRWTRLLSGAALTGTAALAAVGCTSAPATSSSRGAVTPPAVTAAQAAAAYQRIVPVVLAAGNSAEMTAAASSTTDVARVMVSTSQLTARYFNARLPADHVTRLGTPAFYLPHSAGYPQWFVAVASATYSGPSLGPEWRSAPGGIPWETADGHELFLFTKASATASWQLSSLSKLAPGASLPALATGSSGHVPTVSLSDSALLAEPSFTGPLQAGVVDDGPASPSATVVSTGPLTTGIYDNERAGLLGLTAPRGDVLQWNLEGSNYRQFALRTADGGALVFYAMYLNTTVQTPASLNLARPVNPGPAISVPQAVAPLLGHGTPAPRVKLEGQQLLSFAAVDPPANGGKIQVIAIGGDWSYASGS
jgi:LysR family transcriptional regulator, chromosome initiation inhibitor